MKKNMSLALVVMYVVSMILSVSVSAEERTIDRLSTSEVNETFLEDLTSLGVYYDESTSFVETVVYPNDDDKREGKNAHVSLKVLNDRGICVEKTVLFFQNEKGELTDVDLKSIEKENTKSSSSGSYTNYAVVISCTASYEVNTTGGYWRYRPMSVSFSYQVRSGYASSNVGDITVSYRCGGVLETNPGFTVIDSAYTHVISVYQSNPSLGIVYYQSSPLASNRIIDVSIGPFAEQDVQVRGYYGTYYFGGTSSNFS